MKDKNDRYGALIEWGRIAGEENGGYTVESLSRNGVITRPLSASGEHAVGEIVNYFMFDDGTGRIIDSGSGGGGDYLPLSGGTMTGTIDLAPTGLRTYHEAGYATDQFGNFRHKRDNANDSWNLMSNAGDGTFAVKFESGEVNLGSWKASPIEIEYGGTGAANAADARTNLGITPANIGAAAAGHNHDSAYLKLSGGNLTGNVTATNNAYLRTRRNDYTRGETPATSVWANMLMGLDADGAERAYIRQIAVNDGKQGIQIEARSAINGTTYYNGLRMTIDGNGVQTVHVSNAAPWRTALGLGSMATKSSSDYLPTSGGSVTGTITRTADAGTEVYPLNIGNGTYNRMQLCSHADHALGVYLRAPSTSYYERYMLPAPTTTTAHKYYDILTTKNSGTTANVNQSTNKSIPTATYTNLTSLNLSAGTYVLIARFEFATNATGYRWAGIHTASASSSTVNTWAKWQLPAISGAWMTGNITTIVTPTASTTYYLNLYQTSGSALNANGGLMAIRII